MFRFDFYPFFSFFSISYQTSHSSWQTILVFLCHMLQLILINLSIKSWYAGNSPSSVLDDIRLSSSSFALHWVWSIRFIRFHPKSFTSSRSDGAVSFLISTTDFSARFLASSSGWNFLSLVLIQAEVVYPAYQPNLLGE